MGPAFVKFHAGFVGLCGTIKSVVPFYSFHFRIVLYALVVIPAALPAQSHRRTIVPPSKASGWSESQLTKLLATQQSALRDGDPAVIAEATRPLLAYLLRDEAKLRLLEQKNEAAADLFHKSLEFQNALQTRLEFASALLRTGQPQKAANEAAVVLQSDPDNVSALRIKGSAFRSSGDEEGAVKAFSRALQHQPDVGTAFALGSALLGSHQKDKADKIFQQIITASGNAAIWHVAVGDAYREALYLNDAVEQFKQAIALDPRVGHAEFFLGLTYLQLNQWGPSSQSFEHLRAAVRLAPHEYVSNFYLGALESTDGSDLASSNRHLHVAAEAEPDSPEVWLYLGLNAARAQNTAAAKLYLRKAVELTGSDEQRNNYQIRRVYAVLGRMLISEGNRAEGDALLAKYRRTEQSSLKNSAAVIADAAAGDQSRAALSALPVAEPAFPGGGLAGGTDTRNKTPIGSTPSPERATPVTHRTPEENRQLATTERQLSELLASSFNDLGTAEARQGRYEAALADFQQAENWHAPTPALLHNLGTAAFREGNFQESVRALDLYLKAEHGVGARTAQEDRANMMLAMSLFSLGRFGEADKAFSSIPELVLQDPRAAYSWAFSLAHSGQQQHANEIAAELAKQALPSDAMSLVCHIYMDTENYEQSAGCFRKLYEMDPSVKLAHYQVAESLIRLDRPAEAVSELRQELVLTPDSPDVQYSLAFALLQSSHKEEAMGILQTVTAAHPNHAQAQYQLGKALLEQGNTTSAITHLEIAEQNDQTPDYIHYQLQAAYRKAGRVEDADRELRLYRDIKARNREVAAPH